MVRRVSEAKLIRNALIKRLGAIKDTIFGTKYLFYTNVGLSFTLSGIGDVMEQQFEIFQGNLSKWDRRRTIKMAISGIPIGIFCHHYYMFLDRQYPGNAVRIVMKKLFIDQFICSPICITIFYLTVSSIEGQNWCSFVQEFKKKAWRLYTAEWVVWPTAQVVNFYFLPTRYRVLYDNTISLGYDIYTSYVKHDPELG